MISFMYQKTPLYCLNDYLSVHIEMILWTYRFYYKKFQNYTTCQTLFLEYCLSDFENLTFEHGKKSNDASSKDCHLMFQSSINNNLRIVMVSDFQIFRRLAVSLQSYGAMTNRNFMIVSGRTKTRVHCLIFQKCIIHFYI